MSQNFKSRHDGASCERYHTRVNAKRHNSWASGPYIILASQDITPGRAARYNTGFPRHNSWASGPYKVLASQDITPGRAARYNTGFPRHNSWASGPLQYWLPKT
ncbi:hypothetical protein RRG08_053922 [Elysia crispata]|uniref:Uncharacterized protein n=1 Tax=Elysia crispata TaxID=231223 RepID=A0AAE1APC8_9GAST|nr:hypothetical protein RRG08_053922 [Elysia crispata]